MAEGPLKNAFVRFSDAHELWHDAAKAYFTPDPFRIRLNACLQAFRSVTFMLQKQKSSLPGFDAWYAGWQSIMRQDPTMRWLHQARNVVEKEGDLETRSTARVHLISSYFPEPVLDFNVPPSTSPEQVAAAIDALELPEYVRRDGTAQVERRWVDRDLPDMEILSGIAYGLAFLSKMLDHASSQLDRGTHLVPPETNPRIELMSCMATSEYRTASYRLDNHEPTVMEYIPQRIDEKARALAEQRYGKQEPPLPSTAPFAERVRKHFDRARETLAIDRHHVNLAIIGSPGGAGMILSLFNRDKGDKYLAWRRVAQEVDRMRASEVIAIGEAWSAAYTTPEEALDISALPDKTEVLLVEGENASGEALTLMQPFARDESGAIVFGEVETLEFAGGGYLEPVREVWRRWGASGEPEHP